MMLRLSLFLGLLALGLPLRAQQTTEAPLATIPGTAPGLSLAEAVRAGLAANYGIRLARQDEQIATQNVTRGNAGQLPVLNGNLGRTFSNQNIRQRFGENDPRIVNGAAANQLTANVALSWTVFDGWAMFIAYDRLQALEQSQQQLTRATVEETVARITDAYFAVVREAGKIQSRTAALAIGQERLNLTQARVDVGLSAKVEMLTARVDYNADRSALIQQREALQSAKITLNTLLARAPQLDFVPTDSITIDRTLALPALRQGVQERNPRLQQARLNEQVANYNLRLQQASQLPRVGLASTYGLNRNINQAAFAGTQLTTSTTRNLGFTYGVVASVPIFDGLNRRRLVQNAQVAKAQSQVQLEQTQADLAAETEQAYARYRNRLELLTLEEDNIRLARQNVAIALERYRLGLLPALALREAQRSQLEAENRLLDIRDQARQAETTLRRLSGLLELPQ